MASHLRVFVVDIEIQSPEYFLVDVQGHKGRETNKKYGIILDYLSHPLRTRSVSHIHRAIETLDEKSPNLAQVIETLALTEYDSSPLRNVKRTYNGQKTELVRKRVESIVFA